MNRKALAVSFRKRGNMLAMVALTALIIVAILGIGIVVSMLMMSQKRTQSKIETLSLSMAVSINKDDWVGEMNNLTGYSRELVYSSRKAFEETVAHHPRMRPLALQLMDEARQSAALVETERGLLKVLILKDLQKTTNAADEDQSKKGGISLPGVSGEPTRITRVDAGYIDGVVSNVAVPTGMPDLREYDLANKYASEKSNTYLANIDARLPSPDDDIAFEFCSLPAPAKNTLAPERLTANSVFKKLMTVGPEAGNDFTKCKQLPSAVQVTSLTKLNSGNQLSGPMAVTITAASPGATLKLP
jgi:hypothetical protein